MNKVWVANSPEARFLQNINQAALASAGIAAGLALTLGAVLAYTMTRSLREMTEATVEIAKTMVEAQGGSLTAASTPAQRAMFTIRLKTG